MAVDASAAAAAAAEAAETTVETIAAIENAAEIAIEHAENRVEAAQEAANQLADAAMMTELGNRVGETNRRIDEWHEKQLSLETEIANLRATQETILATLTEIQASNLNRENPSSSIQPPSLEIPGAIVEEAVVTAETVDPAQVILPSGADESPVAQTKKRRRIFS